MKKTATILATLALSVNVAQAADDDEMRDLTSSVLLGLGVKAETNVEPVAEDDGMRELTSSVLAGINGSAPKATDTEAPSLTALVKQAVSVGQSDAYLEALIDEAVDNGQLEVPDAMKNTDGDVDTKTVLASLIAKSDGASPSDWVKALQAEANGTNEAPKEDRYYTVVAGDSLAAIAIRYYDSASAYTLIFEANRSSISSPDRIRVGQRLLIPG